MTDIPNIVLCPRGHQLQLDPIPTMVQKADTVTFGAQGVPVEGKQVKGAEGFALPCPSCGLMYWDDGTGTLRRATPIQFVSAFATLSLIIKTSPFSTSYGAVIRDLSILSATAINIMEELTRLTLRGDSIS
jgi:hypothetical protein